MSTAFRGGIAAVILALGCGAVGEGIYAGGAPPTRLATSGVLSGQIEVTPAPIAPAGGSRDFSAIPAAGTDIGGGGCIIGLNCGCVGPRCKKPRPRQQAPTEDRVTVPQPGGPTPRPTW